MKPFSLLLVGILLTNLLTVKSQDVGNRPQITIENASSVVQLGALDAGNANVTSIVFSPDDHYVLSGHPDGLVKIWDLESGDSISLTTPDKTWVNAVAYRPDGAQFAATDGENIVLWDAGSNEQLMVLEGQGRIIALAYSPDGTLLASGSSEGIRIWQTESGEEAYLLEVPASPNDLAFSIDGTMLAATDGNTTGVHLWDVASGESLDELSLPDNYFGSLAFSADGIWLAAVESIDDQIMVWNLETREIVQTLVGHEGGVEDLIFSPSSNVLVSAAQDSTIRLWDSERGSGYSPLTGEFFSLNVIDFNAAGTLIASGTDDGLIQFWGVAEGGPLSLPALPTDFTPQAGHWEGGSGDIDVSFDVQADGKIANFYWRQTSGTSYCTIDLSDESPLDVTDNMFSVISEIDARFRSATSLLGRSPAMLHCGDMFFFRSGGPPTWWVEWVSD